MAGRRAICIIVDGLRASALGAYGNTWRPTPALDRLASQSLVMESTWCRSPNGYTPCFEPSWSADLRATLPPTLVHPTSPPDCRVSCVTDDAERARRWAALENVDAVIMDDETSDAQRDEVPRLTRLFALAADFLPAWDHASLQRPDESHLLWVHAQGMHGHWDAPLDYRQRFCEEGDPPPPVWRNPPLKVDSTDPDELFAFRVAYAAQVALLDQCAEAFFTVLDERTQEQPLLVLFAGQRGFPLGEHGRVGKLVENLYSELLHIPCLLRINGRPLGERWPGLAMFDDVQQQVLRWLSSDRDVASDDVPWFNLEEGFGTGREMLVARNQDGELALRNDQWMLITGAPSDRASESRDVDALGREPMLFVKPDDRWEVNEVASRCPGVVDQLLALIEATAER